MSQTERGTGENIDAINARLLVIEEAVRTNMPIAEDWADWLKEAIREVETGGVVDADWLAKKDKENSYI